MTSLLRDQELLFNISATEWLATMMVNRT